MLPSMLLARSMQKLSYHSFHAHEVTDAETNLALFQNTCFL